MLGLFSLLALGAPANNGHHDLSPAPNEAHHSSASALALLNGKLMLNSGSPASAYVQRLYEEAVAESNETYVAEMLDGTVHAENRLRDALNNMRNERNQARNERNAARSERDSFRDRFNNAQNQANNFRNELNNKRNELAASVSEVGNLRGSLSTVRDNFQGMKTAISSLGDCTKTLPGGQSPLQFVTGLGTSFQSGGIRAVSSSVRDDVVTPFMQSSRSMLAGLSNGMEHIRERVDNATEGEFDATKLKGLPREIFAVIKSAATSFPALQCMVDLMERTPATSVASQGGLDAGPGGLRRMSTSSDGEVVSLATIFSDDSFMMSMIADAQADMVSQFETITGVSVSDVVSPPPPPMTPPSAPSPPPTSIREGWCSSFSSYKRIDAHSDRSLTMDSCFARCTNDPNCHQSVFETADSKWGAQCWLGSNVMTQSPVGSRAQCTDYCYSKAVWEGLPPSPPPSPPPHPPGVVIDSAKVRAGWCSNFRQLSEGHFTAHAHANLDESWCFNRCSHNPKCNQAIFESADSKWGAQCWLGSHGMTTPPKGSRQCPAPGCFDSCYSKAGWAAVAEIEEATVATAGWSNSGAMAGIGGRGVDLMMEKLMAKIPEDGTLDNLLTTINTDVAHGVGYACNQAETAILAVADQISGSAAASLAGALGKPKYDPVLCPLVRGKGGVSIVDAADAIGTRIWTTTVDWGIQRITNEVIEPLMAQLTTRITNGYTQLMALTEGLMGLIPEVGAIIFHILTFPLLPVTVAIVNKLTRVMSRALNGAVRDYLLNMGDEVIGKITLRMTTMGDRISRGEPIPQMTDAEIEKDATDLVAAGKDDTKWYAHLVRPLIMNLAVKPFLARVMQNLVPVAHAEVAMCRTKVQKYKNLVQSWVCEGDYAPDRTFPGTRITYTNSGGGFAAMTGGMGLLRAMHNSGALKRTSYLGGNSGGQWLLSQLLYSKSFFEGVTSNTVPIEEVIRQYGAKYTTTMENFPWEEGNVPATQTAGHLGNVAMALTPGFYKFLRLNMIKMQAIFEKLKTWYNSFATFLNETSSIDVNNTINNVKNGVSNGYNNAVDGYNTAVDAIPVAYQAMMRQISKGVIENWEAVKTSVGQAITSVLGMINDLKLGALNLGKSVVKAAWQLILDSGNHMMRLGKAVIEWDMERKVAVAVAAGGAGATYAVRDRLGGWALNAGQWALDHADGLCQQFGANGIEVLVELITQMLSLPAVDWHNWLTHTLTGPFPEVASATYSQERKGLSGEVTFVQQVAMPPDQYQNTSDVKGRVTLDVKFPNRLMTTKWKAEPTIAFPIAHYSTGCKVSGGCQVRHGWMHHKDVEMTLTVSDTGDPHKDGHKAPVVLPQDPKVLDIVASSSAAMGFLTSPTLIRSLFRGMDAIKVDANVEAFGVFYDHCLAKTFNTMGIAQPSMPLPTHPQSKFRFIDGGFVENTALAATIGKVAADHPSDTYLGKFIHWDLDKTFGQNRVMALFDVKDCKNDASLPYAEASANCDITAPCNIQGEFCTNSLAYGQHNANGIGRPVSRIFNEPFPQESEWTEYAFYNGPIDARYSYQWSGRVTTMKNDFYNVPAGKELDILIFSLNQPFEDQIFAGGDLMAPLWSTVYGDIARQQALGAEPVIRDFINAPGAP